MRRIISVLLVIVIFTVPAKAQDSTAIKQLQDQLRELSKLLVERDSAEYEKVYNELYDGFQQSVLVNADMNRLYDEIGRTEFTAQLLDVNNVDTRIMMKQFEGYFTKLVEDKLKNIVGKDSTRRNNIFRLISNIFQNPIIVPILNSNPITSAINSAFNLISSIVEPKVTEEGGGLLGGSKKISVQMLPIVNMADLEAIKNEVAPYIRFYDTLSILNAEFNTKLINIKQRASELTKGTARSAQYMEVAFGLQASMTPMKKHNLFIAAFKPIPESGAFDRYTRFLMDAKVQETRTQTLLVKEQVEEFNKLNEEYNDLFRSTKQQYLAVIARYKGKLSLFNDKLEAIYARLSQEPQRPTLTVQPPSNPVEKRLFELERKLNDIDVEGRKQVLAEIF